jgi:tetratricopeptide (TPR) repeat protein
MKKNKTPQVVPHSLTDTIVAWAIYSIYFVLFIGAVLTYATPGFMGSFTTLGKKSEAAAISGLGDVAIRQGDYRSAIIQYRSALAIQPDFMAARVNLGTAYFKIGMLQEAAATYHEALDKKPEQPDVIYFYLAQIAEKLGNQAVALQYYENAAEAAPLPFPIWRRIGKAFLAQSQWDSTILYMKKALNARMTIEQNYIGVLKRDKDKYEDDPSIKPQIEKWLEKGIEPRLFQSYDSTVFLTMINRDAAVAETYDILGYAYLMLKDTAAAAIHFRKALEIDPASLSAQRHIVSIR